MKYKTIDEVINKAYSLEDEGKYKEAFEIWNTGFNYFLEEDVKEHEFDIYIGKIWVNYLLKNSEGFINNIIETVEKGYLCPYWMFEYKKDKEYEMFLEL